MSMPLPSSMSFYCLTALILVYWLQLSSAGNSETDRLALHEFKAAITNDPLGILNSWNESIHFCNWLGVTCGRRHRRVTALHLNSSKLTGTLSPFIGNLSFLVVLNLYNNSLMGTIPPEIGRLHRLLAIEIAYNSFGGEIPVNLSCCSSLNLLNVQKNKLVGEIPHEFGSLKYLDHLDLGNNNLTGRIPSSLGNLTSLLRLYLPRNNLIGTIPESLGRLNQLLVLSLGANKLSGVVPSSIFNLSHLEGLDLGLNQFLEGILPLHIGTMLPNLQFFSITTNKFTGSIPASLNNCSSLGSLQLGSNSLQGQVPCLQNLQSLTQFSISDNHLGLGHLDDLDFISCLTNSTLLTILYIERNNFQGAFPSIICNFSMLSTVLLGQNRIDGKIPSCVENLANLQIFDARNNKLSGVIPVNIGKLQKLVILFLSSNLLSGHIPSSIGNLTRLIQLDLDNNNLQGHIPSSLQNCRNLLALYVSQNNLGGRIPTQLFNLSLLSLALDLSENPFMGSLPKEVGQLKNLVVLDISYTRLSGELPSTLGDCIMLDTLYMIGNRFQGLIPQTFSALRGLQVLDMSANNFSGKVPIFLKDFPLKMLNLSYNDLEGEVPIGGIFNNKSGLSIVGNSRLCGGMRKLNLPPCNSKQGGKRRFGARRLIIAFCSGVFGVGLLVASILLYVICLRKKNIESESRSETFNVNLSYSDILKSTNGFSSENVVGSGAFGTVYKAILDRGISIVAIKTFKLVQKGAYKSFIAECQVLKNVRHRNLVKVITECSSLDHNGNDFKALVYEYMPNGSLEDWLYPQKQIDSVEGTSEPLRSLNLLQRVNIVLDVAFALEYLHYHSSASIIHCDLKPSNVLLDNEMVAHVGDFGLAKFLSNETNSFYANESSSIGVRGTIGYVPPEYGLGNEPSTQGDVYSFGILLLEMFTEKKPIDDQFKDGSSLHGFVKAVWPKRVIEILDRVILKDIVGEEMTTNTTDISSTRKSNLMFEAVTSILGIGLSCSVEFPGERMNMRDVVAKLSTIKKKVS